MKREVTEYVSMFDLSTSQDGASMTNMAPVVTGDSIVEVGVHHHGFRDGTVQNPQGS